MSSKVEAMELAHKELMIRLDKLERENAELRSRLNGESK